MQLDMSKLTDAEKQVLTKIMMQTVLSKMTPERKKEFLTHMSKMAYSMEIQRKLNKHMKVMTFLTIPFFPITNMIQILRVLKLKKMYLKQTLAMAQKLKMLKKLSSSPSMNIISPERKKGSGKIQEDYAS
jgi:hypothetical protein